MESASHSFPDPAKARDQHGLLGEALLVVAKDMKFALRKSRSCSLRRRFSAMIIPTVDSAMPRAQPPALQ